MQTLKPTVKTIGTQQARSITQTVRIRGNSLKAIRREFFKAHPLCAECERQGRVTLAQELDHITPLWAGGPESAANRQGLCITCHDAKTAAEAAQRASMGMQPLPQHPRRRE